MLEIIVAALVILLLTGNIQISGFSLPYMELFRMNGQPITLVNVIIFMVMAWAIGVLPNPFRSIAAVLLVIWVLSVLGILAITGLSNLLVIALIIGIVVSLLKK